MIATAEVIRNYQLEKARNFQNPASFTTTLEPNRRNRGIKLGRLGAFFMSAAVGLGAIGCANQADNRKGTPDDTKSREPFTLIITDAFEIGDHLISITHQQGVNTEGTALSDDKIKTAVEKTFVLAERFPVIPIDIYVGDYVITTPYTLGVADEKEHGYMITKDSVTNALIAGYPTSKSAITVTDLENHTRVSNLALIDPKGLNNFDIPIDGNDFNLYTETCNNMLGIKPTKEADETLQGIFPDSIEDIRFLMLKLGSETICNSYGLAASSRHAGLSYSDYSRTASEKFLGEEASVGLTIPYLVFSKRDWNSF